MKDWQQQAIDQGVHPKVLGFLTAHPHFREVIGPRTWVRVSDTFTKEANDEELAGHLAYQLGGNIATQLMEFIKVTNSLPDINSVLDGTITTVEGPLDPSACYALAIAIAYQLRDDAREYARTTGNKAMGCAWESPEWNKRAGRSMQFVMDNFEPEMSVLYARLAIQSLHLPFTMSRIPEFLSFAEKYRSVVMA